jgi:hypothetical protein
MIALHQNSRSSVLEGRVGNKSCSRDKKLEKLAKLQVHGPHVRMFANFEV